MPDPISNAVTDDSHEPTLLLLYSYVLIAYVYTSCSSLLVHSDTGIKTQKKNLSFKYYVTYRAHFHRTGLPLSKKNNESQLCVSSSAATCRMNC